VIAARCGESWSLETRGSSAARPRRKVALASCTKHRLRSFLHQRIAKPVVSAVSERRVEILRRLRETKRSEIDCASYCVLAHFNISEHADGSYASLRYRTRPTPARLARRPTHDTRAPRPRRLRAKRPPDARDRQLAFPRVHSVRTASSEPPDSGFFEPSPRDAGPVLGLLRDGPHAPPRRRKLRSTRVGRAALDPPLR